MNRESRIIPVMDIMDGQVVHGVAGQREKYEPIRSRIVEGSNPTDVAEAFRCIFGVEEIYIADLDAIMRRNFTFAYLEEIISKTQLRIMLDAGIHDAELAQELLKKGVNKVIIGTETLPSIKHLQNHTSSYSRDPTNERKRNNQSSFSSCQRALTKKY